MASKIAINKFCQYTLMISKSEKISDAKEINPEACSWEASILPAEIKPADEDANTIENRIIFLPAKMRSSWRSLFIIFKYNCGDGFKLSFAILLFIRKTGLFGCLFLQIFNCSSILAFYGVY